MNRPFQTILFAKAPRPGFVKTRLAKSLGADEACDAYCQLVSKLLQQLPPAISLEIRFAPDDAESEIQPWLKPGWSAQPQGDGTLGERLLRAFTQHQTPNPIPCLVIGSDCPDIEPVDLSSAANWLSEGGTDVVLGPAKDGGYWLIGTNKPHSELFQDIDWSTDKVLQQTLSAANRAGLNVRRLRELEDIDTLEDWRRFKARQTPTQAATPNASRMLNQISQMPAKLHLWVP